MEKIPHKLPENWNNNSFIKPIGEAARSISETSLNILAGNADWDLDEFGIAMEGWAGNPANSEEKLAETLSTLREIKMAESTATPAELEALRDRLPFTLSKF